MPAPSRAILVAAVGTPCAYCGDPIALPTRDHLKARARGGTLADGKAIVCQPCNEMKGTRSLAGFLQTLIARSDAKRAVYVAAFMAGGANRGARRALPRPAIGKPTIRADFNAPARLASHFRKIPTMLPASLPNGFYGSCRHYVIDTKSLILLVSAPGLEPGTT
jgi:hypothetical protein